MGNFDPDVLLAKARAGHSLRKNTEKSRKRLLVDVASIDGMSKVVSWCSNRGIDVKVVSSPSGCDLDSDVITLNSRLIPETQLHQLLHECGHFIIENDLSFEERNLRWSRIQTDPKVHTKPSAIEVVDEEIEAWNQGLKLAQKLSVSVDTEAFSRHKAESITSYMKWALDV